MNDLPDRNQLVTTAEKVRARIAERFPDSGLTALAERPPRETLPHSSMRN